MRLVHLFSGLIFCLTAASAQAQITTSPVVLELYTSQNCPYCPEADEILENLAKEDSSLIALSFHVDYADDPDWVDTYATQANSNRQRKYASLLGTNRVFTPQLMVDGTQSVIGSHLKKVQRAISEAKQKAKPVVLTLTRSNATTAVLDAPAAPAGSSPATLYVVHYNPVTATEVKGGVTAGSTQVSMNTVTKLGRLGPWNQREESYQIPVSGNEGVAVLLQNDDDAHVIGAAALAR